MFRKQVMQPRQPNVELKDILAKHAKDVEIEIRLRQVTWMMFTEVIKKLDKKSPKPSITQYIKHVRMSSANSADKDTRIITYVDNKKKDDEIQTKTTLGNYFGRKDSLSYKIAASKETARGNSWPKTDYNSEFFRIIFRASTELIPGWRLDASMVKQFSNNKELPIHLKLITEGKVSMADFMSKESQYTFGQFEIELEWTSNKAPTIGDVDSAIKALIDLAGAEVVVSNEYPREVNNIAREIEDRKLGRVPDLKFALRQVSNLNRVEYNEIYPPINYFLTEKADGFRGILRVNFDTVHVVFNDHVYKYPVSKHLGGAIDGIHNNLHIGAEGRGEEEETSRDGETGDSPGEDPTDRRTDESIPSDPPGQRAQPKAPREPILPRVTFDCEILTNDGSVNSPPKLILPYDVLRNSDGENISKKDFSERVSALEPSVAALNAVWKAKDRPAMRAKRYVHLTSEENLKQDFDAVFKAKYEYEIDGLILSSAEGSYSSTVHYKWKPAINLTIDFLVRECPKKLLGKSPYNVRQGYTLYLLFNGARYEVFKKFGMEFMPYYRELFPVHSRNPGGKDASDYFPVQFSPSIDSNAFLYYVKDKSLPNLDKRIVELRREKDDWIFVKIREERQEMLNANRYFGNDIHTAEVTYGDIVNPIPYEELSNYSASYFQVVKDPMYRAQTAFTSFIKGELIRQLANNNWIIDLGSGKGQDLGRYRDAKISNAIFIDNDPTALNMLAQKQYSVIKKEQSGSNMRAYTIVSDLTDPAEKILEKIGAITGARADAVVCNLAIHYMTTTTEHIDNLGLLISRVLKPGGTFIFTCLDGKRVFDLLEEHNGKWEVTQDSKTKFLIERKYGDKTFTPSGQTIKIKLPFSHELYEENLVNVEWLTKRLAKNKLVCLEYEHFDAKLAQFSNAKRGLFEKMTEDDKKYISLYSYVIMSLK